MGWTGLKISPGFIRDTTRYATSGTWFDGSLVRFRQGMPEKWAGWVDAYPGFMMDGMCRSLHRHGILNSTVWVSAGTSEKFYMISDDFRYDVTPIIQTFNPLGSNLLATTNGSTTVVMNDIDHGHFPGDTVIITGATGFAGIPADELNGPQRITDYIDDHHYAFEVTTPATSTVAAGGGTIKVEYLFHAGTDDVNVGGGWGGLAWSEEEWSGDPDLALLDQVGIWSQDNWGEDLVACAMGGPIFYWDATTPDARMKNIKDLPSPDAPSEAQFIIISHRDRHLLAFGCTAWGGITVEPMTFRWCDQEDIYDWNEASTINTAGSLPLSNGSMFIAGIATAREILVWTDQALYSIQYIGPPYIYTAELLDRWSDICGMKACCTYNGVVYWMGRGGVYAYTGRTEKIDCPVWDYISSNMNIEQMAKVYASSNQLHNEVIWYYPSKDNNNLECDSYVAVDVAQQLWSFGKLPRTAWLDLDALSPVIAASPKPDGRLYEHDNGSDDGSTAPVTPLNAFIESGPIELSAEGAYDKGDRMMFVRRILPDVTFRDKTTQSTAPQMNIVLKMMDKPGGGWVDEESGRVTRATVTVVEGGGSHTEENHVRLRGRSLTLRAESNTVGTNWRLGITRVDMRTDGQQ